MASKKKVSPARQRALEAYNKERRRIQSFVRNAQKRGYIFEHNIIPPAVSQLNFQNVPTVTIKAQTRKLHEQKPIHFYKQATAVSFKTGKIVTGTEKRAEERRHSARLGYINRVEKEKELESVRKLRQYWKEREEELYNELYDESLPEEEEKDYGDYGVNLPTEESKPWEDGSNKTTQDEINGYQQELEEDFDRDEREFQAQQAERDRANKERLDTDKDYREIFETGNVTLQNIQQMIDDAMSNGTYKQAGMDLSIELSQQISQYGRERVAMAIAQAPQEAIEDAQVALNYNPGDERHDKAIIALRELITGEIPSAEELKQMQDRMDADAYTNEP